jgi:type I restriction enzyme S subunit
MKDNKTRNKIVPKLRFPEFRDKREWNIESFEELYSFKVTNSFSRDNLNYANGSVKNIHYGDIHTNFSTLFDTKKELVPYINTSLPIDTIKSECYCKEGDIIFADASEDLDGIGKSIEIVNLNNEKLLSGLHTLLARQKKNKFIIGFGGYLFSSNGIRHQIQKEAQGAKVLGISSGRLSSIKVYYPQNKIEQQKIAGCLSSIDNLITAQSQKLEMLKAHKKGLMQQLFPAEGETVPKLRFPEFRRVKKWKDKQLCQIAQQVTDKAKDDDIILTLSVEHGLIIQDDYFGKRIAGNDTNRYIKVVCNDFVYNDRTTKLFTYGTIKRLSLHHGGLVSPIYKCFRFKKRENPMFWEGYFEARRHEPMLHSLINEGARAGRFNISIQKFLSIFVYYPEPKEQQKIADCLSSIDNLICAQSQKLEMLKTHKKGLMQQLFPNMDNCKINKE